MAFSDHVERVEVLDPGLEPRTVLRYDLDVGHVIHAVATDHLEVRQQLSPTSAADGGDDVLAVKTEATVETSATVMVTEVDAGGGDTRFEIETEVTAVELTAVSSPEVRRSLDGLAEQTVGTMSTRTWDDRGRSLGRSDSGSLSLGIGGGVGARSLPSGVTGAAVVLPEEPVGEGATWRVNRDMSGGSGAAVESLEVTLLAVSAPDGGAPPRLELQVVAVDERDGSSSAADTPALDDRSLDSHFSAVLAVDLSEPLGTGQMTSSAIHVADADTTAGRRSIEQRTTVRTTVAATG